ncbi:MAG: SDR family NAD(P)-dependent oxidoreductase [Dehalococcoidia bacterium]
MRHAARPRLVDKVAIVTGAGNGIGRGIALALAAEGASLAINDLQPRALAQTRTDIEALGAACVTAAGDVSDAGVVAALARAAFDAYGRVDVLVNNVGGGGGQNDILSLTPEDWRRCFDVTLGTVFHLSRAVLPSMIERRGGSIVNIGSSRGVSARPHAAGYASAKAAVIHLTKCMAVDYAEYSVRCNCICPGAIATERTLRLVEALDDPGEFEQLLAESTPEQAERYQRLRENPVERAGLLRGTAPIPRRGEPYDIAMAAVYLASDESRYVTGTVLMVDGGRSA